MMKNFFLLLLVALVMVSCLDDDDSNLTGTYFGVVSLSDDVMGYKIMLDGQRVAVPSSSDVEYTPKDSDRVYVSLEFLDGVDNDPMDVKLLALLNVATADLVTYDTLAADTLGSDPVAVMNGYVWQSCHYLTFYYEYNLGLVPKNHSFNLVYYPDSVGDNGEVFLKFQHNANSDLEQTSTSGYKSFNMASIAPFANVVDSVAYTIKINAGDFSSAASYFEGYYYKN